MSNLSRKAVHCVWPCVWRCLTQALGELVEFATCAAREAPNTVSRQLGALALLQWDSVTFGILNFNKRRHGWDMYYFFVLNATQHSASTAQDKIQAWFFCTAQGARTWTALYRFPRELNWSRKFARTCAITFLVFTRLLLPESFDLAYELSQTMDIMRRE